MFNENEISAISDSIITALNDQNFAKLNSALSTLKWKEQANVLEQALESELPKVGGDIRKPNWLETDFDAAIWLCNFGKSNANKAVNFNIVLDDGRLLTESIHRPFLNTLKYWLCAIGQPQFNGHNALSLPVIYHRFVHALLIIDYFLLRSKKFRLSEFGLGIVNKNDLLCFFTDLAIKGKAGAIYDWESRLCQHLKKISQEVAELDVINSVRCEPQLLQLPSKEDRFLRMSEQEIIQVKTWLYSQGVYQSKKSINRVFANEIYQSTLSGTTVKYPVVEELQLTPEVSKREFIRVPIDSSEENGMSEDALQTYFSLVKQLIIVSDDVSPFEGFLGVPAEQIDELSMSSIEVDGYIKPNGRYRSLPATTLLPLVKDAAEFTVKYGDHILACIKKLLIWHNSVEPPTEAEINKHVLKFASKPLRLMGLKRWKVSKTQKNQATSYFDELRSNVGLVELYRVLIGCIQLFVGLMMARRSAELRELENNFLLPKNIDPTDPENSQIEYFLTFSNGKSGSGDDRESLSRPIMLFGARWLWKLSQFKSSLQKAGLVTKKSKLFLTIDFLNLKVKQINNSSWNANFDLLCDYFESETVEWKDGTTRRFYIRQHQLRRFFAMCFFHSSAFDGLDTLRWFLGHTDMEHLYHYITESTPGPVLRGVKSERIIYGLKHDDIQGVEKLREMLLKRLGVDKIKLSWIVDHIDDLEIDVGEGFIETDPPIEEIRKQLENNIESMLDEGVISLEPEFVIKHSASGDTQEMNFVLIVKDLDHEE